MARNRSREMVGRDTELARLLEHAEHARDGQGGVVLVTGEAGLGKSRLVAELADRLDDALVLVAHGVDMSTGEIPFGVVADLLRDLTRKEGEDALLPEETEALAPLLPGRRVDPSRGGDRVAMLAASLALLERLSTTGLVCWVLEDLHWADAASRDLLNLVAHTAAERRVLVVATVRVDDPDRSSEAAAALTSYMTGLARLPSTDTIALRRLDRADVQRQLANLVTQPLPTTVAQRIADLSDGLPFAVEELAAGRGDVALTSTAAVATARLDSLGPEARRLVEATAVGDGHLRLALVEQVLDVTAEELDDALTVATRAGVLDGSGDDLGFRHALLRDAVARATPPGARRSWHRRWAEVLEENTGVLAADPVTLAIAEHWAQAGDAVRAMKAALGATDAARRTGSTVTEFALWSRILELWPTAGSVAEAAGVDHATVAIEATRMALTIDDEFGARYLAGVVASTDDARLRGVLEARLAAHSRAKGEHVGAELTAARRTEIERLLRDGPVDTLFAEGMLLLSAFHAIDDERGERLMEEARAAAVALGALRTELHSWAAQAWRLQMSGHPDVAAEQLERVLARPGLESSYDVWGLDGNLMWCLYCLGRHEEANAAAERAIARVADPRAIGSFWEHIVENAVANWEQSGHWGRAVELVVTSKPFWGEGAKMSDIRLARLELLRTGHVDDIDGWWQSLEEPDAPGGPDRTSRLDVVAREAGMRGDLATMRGLLGEVWDTPDPAALTDILWSLVRDVARLEVDASVATGRNGEAAAHLERIERVAAKLHRLGDLGDAWPVELEAQLARFRDEDARDLFVRARAAWERVGHPYDVAVCDLVLAEQYARHGDRDEARRHAAAARDAADALGAGPLGTQARALLDRLGGRAASTSALTAREHEVLELLALGRTNEQIAAELFMSPKTASVHVSRIITKLGAANRTEAASLARRAGLLA